MNNGPRRHASQAAPVGEINAQLLMLEGKLLRIQFAYKIDKFDLTPAQAMELGKLLIDHAARMTV